MRYTGCAGPLSKSRTLALVGLLAGLVLHLTGCSTVAGFGRDVEKLGDKIERKAEQSKRY